MKVISAAFQLLEQADHNYAQWLEEIRKQVEVGIEQQSKQMKLAAKVAAGDDTSKTD